jgi:hypothetical protein
MNGKIAAVVIVLTVLGIAGGYYLGSNYKLILQPHNDVAITVPAPSPTQEVQVLPSAKPSPVPTVDEAATIIAAVKAGLIAEHGSDAGTLTITVSKISGNFAQGGAAAAGGGGMWFAAKIGGVWKLAWDGNGMISCASINPYNFPVTMIPECWDNTTQESVTR